MVARKGYRFPIAAFNRRCCEDEFAHLSGVLGFLNDLDRHVHFLSVHAWHTRTEMKMRQIENQVVLLCPQHGTAKQEASACGPLVVMNSERLQH